ncbi:MAG TPA: site-2 protease family protein [Anaerolineales bacterium]|nr:site-2 protease family protein [Anaerolineales bacterium]
MDEYPQGMFTYESLLQRQFNSVAALRAETEGLMRLGDVKASDRGDSVVFIGRLLTTAEDAYRIVGERFRRLGYTAFLRRENGEDVIVAQRGVSRLTQSNPLINLALLLATIATTMFAGAGFAQVNIARALQLASTAGQWGGLLEALAAGAPFAITLLLILGVHEMGHYIAARIHGVSVTLPYFIPFPFGLGTFGAFIQLKSPVENRKALFDVGLAGPVAGFVVAVPLLIVGLLASGVVPSVSEAGRLGTSVLVRWLLDFVHPHGPGYAVALHPIAIAAWFGMLVTGFNLLPMGQLDGGHVAYAVLGKFARPLAYLAFGALILMGFTVWSGWWTWAFLAMLTGLRHAQPLNDITPLDPVRKFVGALTLLWFLLIITPKPF